MYKHYTTKEYPKYDNYDTINVNKIADIPVDYNSVMVVPITFLDKYNPEQFEIIGELSHGSDNQYDFEKPKINGKEFYNRILIKRKTGSGADVIETKDIRDSGKANRDIRNPNWK